MSRKTAYRKRRQNRFSMFLAMFVVGIMMAAVAVMSYRLTRELQEKEERKAELQQEIAEEQQRSEELDEYEKYVQTDQFKEKMAREKLGMVKDGEIVFEDEGSN